MRRAIAPLYVAAGWICLALGFVGIFLPLLPTTPFVLLAAYCFSRGSRRLHAWLLASRTFGPIIVDWERYGVIRPRAKALSLGMMALLFGYTLIFVDVKPVVKGLVAAIGLATASFIASRPSRPRDAAEIALRSEPAAHEDPEGA